MRWGVRPLWRLSRLFLYVFFYGKVGENKKTFPDFPLQLNVFKRPGVNK